ncbi:MAG: 4Fe-4S dicluster domain-containing protein [Firmicutes bacterium]|nr:4Fe-4S dicluster domain-containing protein [Bacillota bacterium]
MAEYAVLIDTRFCTGCNTCFYKCIQENRLHGAAAQGIARTTVLIRDEGMYHHRCMHCKDPSCAAVCPTGALARTGYGAVLYDVSLCIGCRSCVAACPFHVPQWNEARKEIVKCSLCAHRIQVQGTGKVQPACVEACPTGALMFGEFDTLAAAAEKIAAEEKLHLYGRAENGGTRLFVLTKEDPLAVGYPRVPRDPAGSREVKTVGGVVVGAAAVAALAYAGFKKYSERRSRMESGDQKLRG